MNRRLLVTLSAALLLAGIPAARAQNCSNLNNTDFRGTYTLAGTGWVDLSKFLATIPGLPPLPTGFVPTSWVGAATLDGIGGGGGWLSFNAGGSHMTAQLVNVKYSIASDCGFLMNFSMKINELGGAIVGPFARPMVPVFRQAGMSASALEMHMIWQGNAAGTAPGPVSDSAVAYRISMQN